MVMRMAKRILVASVLAVAIAVVPRGLPIVTDGTHVGLGLSLGASSVYALPIQQGGGTTSDDLKKQGYTCERVGVNFWECTKSGSPTYWCTDSGDCQPAPTRTAPGSGIRAPLGPASGAALSAE
jgi:hypothetical protein